MFYPSLHAPTLEITDEEHELWRIESTEECRRVVMVMGFVIALALTLKLSSQVILNPPDANLAHVTRTIPIQIALSFLTGLALWKSALAQRHAIAVTVAMAMGVGGMGGVVLGGLGGFDGPFFYSVYVMPSFIMLLPCELPTRIAATASMVGLFVSGFMWQHGVFDPVRFDIALSTLAMTSSVCMLLGHRGWVAAKQEFVATRRLEEDRERARGQNVTLADRLRGQARRAEALAHELDDAKLSTRASIARDLHDDVGQLLVGARMELEMLDRQVGSGERLEVDQFDRLQGVMGGLEGGIRDMIGRLRDADAPVNLGAAIQGLLEAPGSREHIHLELDPQALSRLSQRAHGVAYRVVQEGLTNAAKHSDSSTRWVSLELHDDRALLRIEDDGSQPLPGDPEGLGWGLLGLRERVESVGGSLLIQRFGGRTSLLATLPLRATPYLVEAAS